MSWQGLAQIALLIALVGASIKPLGGYMARVYSGERVALQRAVGWLERLIYRAAGVPGDATAREQKWTDYAFAMLAFNAAGVLFVYAVSRLQASLPLNPAGMTAPSEHLAWNTAVSFATNSNWQSYGGETTMSLLTQSLALATQNFVSAASGMAVLVALIRGLSRKESPTIGNFWADLVRGTLYILLPLSIAFALFFVSQGVVQTLEASHAVPLLQATHDADGKSITEQVLALGPVASQLAIKQLGTNGGGFFNVNSAHPFENSSPLSNLAQIYAIMLIPASLTYTFGAMVKDSRQGWAILAAMSALALPLLWLCISQEQAGNPALAPPARRSGDERDAIGRQHGGQGGPLRHRRERPLRHRHDDGVVRRRQ